MPQLFPTFRKLAGGIKKAATTPIKMPRMGGIRPKPRAAMQSPSSPIGAGARYAKGMTSGKNVTTYATRGQAKAVAGYKNALASKVGSIKSKMGKTPLGSKKTRSRFAGINPMGNKPMKAQAQNKFLQGQRVTKRRSSAGFSSFARLVNFAIHI